MGSENLNPVDELKAIGRQIDQVTDLASLKPVFDRLTEISSENPHDFEVQLTVGDLKQQIVNRGNRIREMQKATQAKAPAMPPLPGSAKPGGPPSPPPAVPPMPSGGSAALPPTVVLPPRPAAPKPTPPPAPPAVPPLAKAPEIPPVAPGSSLPSDLKATRRMSSGQFDKPEGLANPPAGGPPTVLMPPSAKPPAPPQPPAPRAPVIPPPKTAAQPPIPPSLVPPAPGGQAAPPPMPFGPPGSQVPTSPGPTTQGPSTTRENTPPVIAAGAVPPTQAPPQVQGSTKATVSQGPGQPPGRPPGAPGTAATPPPNKPVAWKRALVLGALAGSVLSILLIVFLVNQARKRNPNPGGGGGSTTGQTVSLAVTTTPPGAAVHITSPANTAETNCTADCNVPLAPGTYQVTAVLGGYQTAASGVTIASGQPASVALTLEPMPQSVRILSDLDQGKVTFDSLPAADLQEGQLILDNVAAGAHSVKITGRSGDASFTFEIAPGKAPVITGPVTARNLVTMLVASSGSQAHIVTNSGPLKLTVNGQPQTDASPAGVDVTGFQSGVDEMVLGDGKDQRNVKENFGPAPMLTAFLKSDLNIGTLIVATGEDDVRVFLNDKEYRRKTQRGQVRIPTIGKVSVRVAKDGFQNDPAQVAEVKKGAEVRLEFKMQPVQQMSTLQIRGGTPGAEVLIDQKSVGAIGDDGAFTSSAVPAGDHTIELRRDQYQPRRLQRPFRAGQTISLSGADVVLSTNNATVKLARNPADALVFYRRESETQNHEIHGNQVELPPGAYILTARAPGYAEHSQRIQINAGETRAFEVTLAREKAAVVAAAQAGGITDFVDPNAWKQQDGMWVHSGAGFVPYKLKPNGTFTFTVELLKGGNIFRGGRIRWGLQYSDAKNYDLFEIDKKNFWSKVIVKGKSLERPKVERPEDKEKAFTVQIEVSPDRVTHRLMSDGKWITLDNWSEAGRDFTDGKFGFVIQGNDAIGISEFKFTPK